MDLLLYILLHALSALGIKAMARADFATSEIMVWRGVGCMGAAALWAVLRSQRYLPRRWGTQGSRVLVAGISLWLLTAAYAHASATSVAVVQRMDIALLILLSGWIGERATGAQRTLALAVLGAFAAFAWWGAGAGTSAKGLLLAFAGMSGTCVGFLLLKGSTREESEATIAAVAGGAIVLFGVLSGGLPNSLRGLPLGLGAGAAMFGVYVLTVQLYRRWTVAKAEFPTLLAVGVVAPLEYLWWGVRPGGAYLAFVGASLVGLGGILWLGSRELGHEN